MSEDVRHPSGRAHPLALPNATVFLASMAIMIAELVAGRLVSRFLGQSLYTWTSCIGVFLTGISLGNYVGGRLADRYAPRATLAWLFLLSSLSCLLIAPLNGFVGSWSWLWEQSLPVRIFVHVSITFLPCAMALGTISPVAARMALAEGLATGRTIGQVYAWGAAGSILGTYLTGFYLVARWGTMETLMGVAALLALLALLGCPRRSVRAGGAALLLLPCWMLAGGCGGDALAHALQVRPLPDPALLFEDESPYAYVAVRQTEGRDNLRTMVLDRLTHSQVDISRPRELIYDYHKVFAALTDVTRPGTQSVRALVLGGGGFVFPTYLEHTRPGSEVDVAEIDPDVTRAARAAFGFSPSSGIHVHEVDGRMLVDRLRRERSPGYQFIYGDIVSDLLVPYHLVTREFCAQLRDLLTPDGVYMVIIIDSWEDGQFLASFYATMKEVFPEVAVASCERSSGGRDTFVLAGSRQPVPLAEAMEQLSNRGGFAGHVVPSADLEARVAQLRARALTDNHAPVENMLAGVGRREMDDAVLRYTEEGIRAMTHGRTERGLRYLRRAVDLNPGHVPAACNLARALGQVGQLEEALDTVARAVQLAPDEFAPRDLAAMLLMRSGQMPAAMEQWREALRIRPDFIPAMNNIGSALLMNAAPAEALPLFDRALQVDPANTLALYNKATALSALGRSGEALSVYQEAVQRRPDFAEAYVGMGMALERMGQVQRAAAAYQEALRYRPDFAPAQQRLASLPEAR